MSHEYISLQVKETANKWAQRVNDCSFIMQVKKGSIAKQRFYGFIVAIYPIVFGFTDGLRRMIGHAKFDPVRDAVILKGLARQLIEEIGHNELYRDMLANYNIDYTRLYDDFCSPRGMANFPKPVVAMYKHIQEIAMSANPWTYLACQMAMEAMILTVVTDSIYPGVNGSPDLNSLHWWREHRAKVDGKKSAEARHLQQAGIIIDQKVLVIEYSTIMKQVKETCRLFAGTIFWHNHNRFDFSHYKL